MKQALINRLGILGIVSFLSYFAAVVFSPLAYPGYSWLRQAVSDLSAADAPSRVLWGQLSCLYGVCALVSLTLACVFVQGRMTRTLRLGVYLFTAMNATSYVGYGLFPLTSSGYAGTVQDVMHMVVTGLVVGLSIASLVLLVVGGARRREYEYLAIGAGVALAFMCAGPLGIGLAPASLFGFFERFSTLSAAAFTLFLGVCLMMGFEPARAKASENPSAPA